MGKVIMGLLSVLLSLLLGKLKPVLIKHIETVDAETITGEEKRAKAIDAFRFDLTVAGKEMGKLALNLAIEAAVAYFRKKI